MKFVDEATIQVHAGKGGAGSLSFRRERFVAKGGPDGGDGGDGGSVYLRADSALNTLVDFRYQRQYRAESGRPGAGQQRTGAKGEDLVINVPVGTTVIDTVTGQTIGDLVEAEQQLLVAQGGFHGLGNTRYKSSVNRAPRQTSPGSEGESLELLLELKLLADVGLLGMPNAGKSSFIRAVSSARPKVADYPFTTLVPQLGVVSVNPERSFVVADIPGVIDGAASGAGLGIRFLRHLARTRLLLHIIDMQPIDGSLALQNMQVILDELAQFSPALRQRELWLVLNKSDLLQADDLAAIQAQFAPHWGGKVFTISTVDKNGLKELCSAIAMYLEEDAERRVHDSDYAKAQALLFDQVQEQGRERMAAVKLLRDTAKAEARREDEGDDGDVDVEYVQ